MSPPGFLFGKGWNYYTHRLVINEKGGDLARRAVIEDYCWAGGAICLAGGYWGNIKEGVMKKWISFAAERGVVIRAIKYAIVVGVVLIVINHGDAILRGEVTAMKVLQMGLTVLVPYAVSTLSSVGAMIDFERQSGVAGEGGEVTAPLSD